jgi:hypothetical protein
MANVFYKRCSCGGTFLPVSLRYKGPCPTCIEGQLAAHPLQNEHDWGRVQREQREAARRRFIERIDKEADERIERKLEESKRLREQPAPMDVEEIERLRTAFAELLAHDLVEHKSGNELLVKRGFFLGTFGSFVPAVRMTPGPVSAETLRHALNTYDAVLVNDHVFDLRRQRPAHWRHRGISSAEAIKTQSEVLMQRNLRRIAW